MKTLGLLPPGLKKKTSNDPVVLMFLGVCLFLVFWLFGFF